MTDNLESNQTEGSAGLPNSAVSQGQGVSSTSTFDASKLPEQLESLVTKAVEKAVQSQKDKRFSAIEKDIGDFKPVLEQVKSLLNPEQLKELSRIERDAEFEELKRAVYGQAKTGTQTTGTPKSTADEVQAIFQEYNVDPNDPEATPLLALKGVELIKAVSKLALKRAKPSAVDSSEASALRTEPSPPASVEAATQKYKEDMLKARGNRALLADIKAKARKNGVPVDSVDFT